MKTRLGVLLLCVCASARLSPLLAQETSLTIYADGRVLVRRTIPVSVPRGASTVGVDLGVRDLDPGSLVSLDSAVEIRGARISAAIGLEGSLRRAIGTDVVFRTASDSAPGYVRARILSVDPAAVRLDGNVMYGWPGTPVFPDSLVQLTPRYELSFDAARTVNALRLMFMSSGLAWHASYSVLLPRGGEGDALVSGSARLDNTGAVTLRGAQVQLVAGEVRRAALYQPVNERRVQVSAMMVGGAQPGSVEEGVGEVHVYTLPGTVDFTPGESRVIALFSAQSVPVGEDLVLRPSGYPFNGQWGEPQRDLHPDVTYRLRRPAASAFGAIVVPGGSMRLFMPDSAGRMQLIGEAPVPHTPAGRDIQATTGTAFDLTAQRTQTEFQQNGPREAVSAYRVDLQNAKAQSASVLVADYCPLRCEVLASSVPPEPGDAVNTLAFRVTVPANGSATLTYRVRARW